LAFDATFMAPILGVVATALRTAFRGVRAFFARFLATTVFAFLATAFSAARALVAIGLVTRLAADRLAARFLTAAFTVGRALRAGRFAALRALAREVAAGRFPAAAARRFPAALALRGAAPFVVLRFVFAMVRPLWLP
jgi:hypothetical protein